MMYSKKTSNLHDIIPDNTIDSCFFKTAQLNSHKTALRYCSEDITYASLEEKINNYAKALKANSVRYRDVVGVLLPRCPEMAAVLFAIMKLGAVFLPIDKTYPLALQQYIINQSNCRVLINDSSHNLSCPHVISLRDLQNQESIQNQKVEDCSRDTVERTPQDSVYYIFTSGSTGNPKGVMIKHESVVNLIKHTAPFIGMVPGRTILFLSNIGFDMSIHELILSLCTGMTVIIATEKDIMNPRILARLIQKTDTLLLTPSRFRQLILVDKEGAFLEGKKSIYFGGEALTTDIVNQIKGKTNASIFNLYGPSETTLFTTCMELTHTSEIAIGRPVHGTNLLILDEDYQVVPDGEKGQIVIGGIGVGLGYVNSPEMTARHFIQVQHIPLGTLFATGDLGWKDADGCFVYGGRMDNQIKHMGYRIELEEIESKASCFPGIRDCLAAVIQDMEQAILSLFYTSDMELNPSEIKSFLDKYLPYYMIPNYYVRIDAVPVNHNGKVQRDNQFLINCLPRRKNEQSMC